MCLVSFAIEQNTEFPLVILANRDEFYERPTQPAHWWEDSPNVLAGRDLQAGGTWMGVERGGKLALLTNFRSREAIRPEAPSRGELVANFLREKTPAESYLDWLVQNGPRYSGFNLVFGEGADLWYYSNQGGEPGKLAPGFYGLSNALLDDPWPKVQKAKSLLQQEVIAAPLDAKEAAFAGLKDDRPASEASLPDTGVGLEWEKLLSPMFIESPAYGTRLSTLLLRDREGKVWYEERSYQPDRQTVRHHFQTQ